MNLLEYTFEFKGNVPSICGIRLGESYHEMYDVLSCIEDRNTGKHNLDYLLDEYNVYVDVDTNEYDRISRIRLKFCPFDPFDYSDMEQVGAFLRKAFDYSTRVEHTEEAFGDEGIEYDYSILLCNNLFRVEAKKQVTNHNLPSPYPLH